MGSGRNKFFAPYLFVLIASAGIAMFVSAWNSYLQGKGKMFLSLGFLVVLLIGILALYFQFIRIVAHLKNNRQAEPINSDNNPGSNAFINTEALPGREGSGNLLSGAFGKPDMKITGEKILKNLAREFDIVQGVFYVFNSRSGLFTLAATYAVSSDTAPKEFAPGEGITGQAVADAKIMTIPNLPSSYSPVVSGLGKGKAGCLYIIPLIYEKKALAVIEISCFKAIEEAQINMLSQLMREGGSKLNSVLNPETK